MHIFTFLLTQKAESQKLLDPKFSKIKGLKIQTYIYLNLPSMYLLSNILTTHLTSMHLKQNLILVYQSIWLFSSSNFFHTSIHIYLPLILIIYYNYFIYMNSYIIIGNIYYFFLNESLLIIFFQDLISEYTLLKNVNHPNVIR